MDYRRRRWCDGEKYWKCFTWAKQDGRNSWTVKLRSGDEEYPGSYILLQGFGWTFIIETPGLLKPLKQKVIAQYWDAATIEKMGRNWYENIVARDYGFTYSDGSLHSYYGAQTWDSCTNKAHVYFMPWTETRHVRSTFYDVDGSIYKELKNDKDISFDPYYEIKQETPKVTFEFTDYDGEVIQANTLMHEREYKYGRRQFKWISLFKKSNVWRTLDIEFTKEVGREKGSWKGGTLGHSIEMEKGELHEEAFIRYCNLHQMEFIKRV
jgi:hypothetical protein